MKGEKQDERRNIGAGIGDDRAENLWIHKHRYRHVQQDHACQHQDRQRDGSDPQWIQKQERERQRRRYRLRLGGP